MGEEKVEALSQVDRCNKVAGNANHKDCIVRLFIAKKMFLLFCLGFLFV